MELMSSAFVCVLLAMLPQTLGKSRNRNSPGVNIKFNSTVVIQQKPMRKALLLNINGPSLVTNISDLQAVFNDLACRDCDSCMERAIKAHKSYVYKSYSRPSAEELREDVLTNEILRAKRDVSIDNTTDIIFEKKKTRKGKFQKTITVTKYNMDGEVYAIKVKVSQMSIEQQNNTKATCQVYSVKKSFPCESPEADTLMSSARRKAIRGKAKSRRDKKYIPTTMKSFTTVFRKREVDSSQAQENFMPSVEEFTD